jgi:hypothetical protein
MVHRKEYYKKVQAAYVEKTEQDTNKWIILDIGFLIL